MGALATYLINKSLDHLLNVASYSAPATLYFAAFVAGVEVTGGSYARKAVTNNTTNFPNSSSRAKTNGTAIPWVTASASWGTVDEVRIYDASTSGNELARDAITGVAIGNGDTLTIAVGDLDIVASAGAMADAHVHKMLDHAFGGVAWTAEASLKFAYFAGDPQGAGSEITGTSYARITKTSNGTTWGAASGGVSQNLIDFDFPSAGGTWVTATYWALFDAAGSGLVMSAALPASRTVTSGQVESIAAGRIRPTWS